MESSNNYLRKAFSRVKNDIIFLNNEILNLKISINDINNLLNKLSNKLENISISKNRIKKLDNQTIRHINKTYNVNSTDNSTVPMEIGGLKAQKIGISIGNKGVSTDRQTDRQTDNSTSKLAEINPISTKNIKLGLESDIKEAAEILESLDSIKKEIRRKFKHLTHQEMLVFSTIYQLEEQDNKEITYKLLSTLLRLSESSLRDYIQRIINKGIPLKKEKMNNKQIFISISHDLKRIATLSTILKLREL